MDKATLLLDANVLIDFEQNLAILRHVSENIGQVAVLREVLGEVDELTDADCESMGVEIIPVETELLLQAAESIAGLSFQDRLCLLVCKGNGWTCVTNDRALQKQCQAHGVTTMFGLQLMIDLVEVGAISSTFAMNIALETQKSSPQHINDKVISRFRRVLGELGS